MIATPIRLDRVQGVLFEIIRDEVLPSVAWAFGEPSFDIAPEDHVSLEPFGGPTARERRNARGRVIIPVESVQVTVTSAALGLRPILRVNGFDIRTDTEAGDTLSDVRDRLIAAVEEDELEPVSASIVDADTLLLEADSFGAIRSLELVGPLAWSNVVDQAPATLIEGSALLLVRVRAYSKKTELWRGATATMSRLEAALQTPDVIEKLQRFGVSIVDIGTPVDISAIAGARWSSRSETILTLALWSGWTRPADVIEIAQVTQTARDLAGTQIEARTYQIGS